ncbi:tail fiber assembly protein [Enterobacter hormaechei]|nr:MULTISPECIES: tail fiber assembly protein [Enterobacter]MBU5512445.1 tail fiber assembly protein [Enterobacteriaceae bacterium S18_ASV_15]MBU5540136.1 tail fiber assembly protein [Pluralibacter sp. S10_ASV_43]MBU5633549.1 tail fiber assembly protein [Enterobacteriaceae bacterium S29_ASV_15]MBU5652800.1 tail fiber assembly protein [Enterobacteriaceae bacterium S22_ASV_15]EKS6398482.1 tail fiber assembly protein [Enterobacter hormaechei]
MFLVFFTTPNSSSFLELGKYFAYSKVPLTIWFCISRAGARRTSHRARLLPFWRGAQQAELQKQTLISQANEYIDSKQWPSKLALGRLKDDEKASFNKWLDYLDALESVDPSKAPEIVWPTI